VEISPDNNQLYSCISARGYGVMAAQVADTLVKEKVHYGLAARASSVIPDHGPGLRCRAGLRRLPDFKPQGLAPRINFLF